MKTAIMLQINNSEYVMFIVIDMTERSYFFYAIDGCFGRIYIRL